MPVPRTATVRPPAARAAWWAAASTPAARPLTTVTPACAHPRASFRSEVELALRRPAGELAHQRALARDGPGQLAMPLGINAVDARAEDRDRPAASREGGMVGRGVDAGGEAAHHRDAGLREPARQLRGHPPAVVARAPRPDDGDRRLGGPAPPPAPGQHEGRLGGGAGPRRVRPPAPR